MKTRYKAIAAVGAAAVLGLGLFMLNTASHRKDYSPLPSGLVDEGIYAIEDVNIVRFMPCASDFFVLKAGGGLILFDTAMNSGRAAARMAELGLDPLKVAAVFLTHSDREHAGALRIFPNARVYVGEGEVPLLEGRRMRAPFLRNSLEAPYRTVSDGDRISFGGVEVRCIAVPGHTPGSTAYLVDGTRLFPGDALAFRGGKAVKSAGLFVDMDGKEYDASVAKLAGLEGVGAMYTDHYGVIRDFGGAFVP